jgi:CRP/FNR family transcriptional regulator, cyclic AMP receptor protein
MALTPVSVLKIERGEMIRGLREEQPFCEMFISFVIARNARIQKDLVDQLFNSSEKRLARALLLLAQFGNDGAPETVIPKISQETLAEMVGTTRSRVSFFMNRFRKQGFIEYNGKISVHRSLLNVILRDYVSGPSDAFHAPSLPDRILIGGKVKSLSLAGNASAWECRYGQDILPHPGKGSGIYDSGWDLSLRF